MSELRWPLLVSDVGWRREEVDGADPFKCDRRPKDKGDADIGYYAGVTRAEDKRQRASRRWGNEVMAKERKFTIFGDDFG